MNPDPPPVLYCYDGSETARHALELAAGVLAGRPAMVVCVWQPLVNIAAGVPYAVLPADLVEQADDAARDRARELAGEGADLVRAGAGDVMPRAVAAHGSVWQAILEVAEQAGASAIVVGSRGLTGVRSVLLGSVSHGVVNHSHRPVLVIPPPGQEAVRPAQS